MLELHGNAQGQCTFQLYTVLQYWRKCKGYSLQIFRICFFSDFLQLNNLKLEFSSETGLYGCRKKKSCTPIIDQKCHFPSDKQLMCNFNSGNGLIDPKSVSKDIKLIFKVFEINTIGVNHFSSDPSPPSLQPKISFLARSPHTVSFFGGFLNERYQIAREDLPLQIHDVRHVPVPNVSETSPLYSPPLVSFLLWDCFVDMTCEAACHLSSKIASKLIIAFTCFIHICLQVPISVIKITVVRQVHMSHASTAVWAWR